MNHDINNLGSIVYWLYLSWFLKAFRLSDLLTHMHIIVLYIGSYVDVVQDWEKCVIYQYLVYLMYLYIHTGMKPLPYYK